MAEWNFEVRASNYLESPYNVLDLADFRTVEPEAIKGFFGPKHEEFDFKT